MPLDQDMYKALNEAWEKQKQVTTSKPTWGDGFLAGKQVWKKEKRRNDFAT